MILRRTLKVSEVTDDKLILVHVIHRIELNRVNEVNIQLRTADLLEKAVNAYLFLLERQIRNRADVEQMAARKTMRNQSDQRGANNEPMARKTSEDQLKNRIDDEPMAARKTMRNQSDQKRASNEPMARETLRNQSNQRGLDKIKRCGVLQLISAREYDTIRKHQLRNGNDERIAIRKTVRSQSYQREQGRKKPGKHENGSLSESSKRRRTRPTGLNFDD
uniref:Gag-pol polyprotein n=1 Tax=Elaeophora elaphi TaxID=1147741 RepID=A0A0R3RWG7_9BILA